MKDKLILTNYDQYYPDGECYRVDIYENENTPEYVIYDADGNPLVPRKIKFGFHYEE